MESMHGILLQAFFKAYDADTVSFISMGFSTLEEQCYMEAVC